MIDLEKRDDIAVIYLSNGDRNPLGPEMVDRLGAMLGELEEDPSVMGLVLASSAGRFFSIGFDLPHLFDLPREEFAAFFKAFNRTCVKLYAFPRPTAAAVEGHATAGGFILTLACDQRFVAEGNILMGLNEARLGVPVPRFSALVLERIAGREQASGHIEEGEFFGPEEAFQMGVTDQLVRPGGTLTEALGAVRGVDAGIAGAYADIKGSRTKKIREDVLQGLEEETEAFLDLWYSPPAREMLKKAMEKY